MDYILQVFTGGFNQEKLYTSDRIIARLEEIGKDLSFSKVIIGWNNKPGTYRAVKKYLSSKGIDMILWLPVLSEIGHLEDCKEVVDIYGNKVSSMSFQEGEDFTFYCPSSEKNFKNVKKVYDELFSDCGFDGVFLDKIRTQSFVGGTSGVLSCGCEECRQKYKQKNVSLEEVGRRFKEKGDEFFSTKGYKSGFIFEDELLSSFFKAKEEIIAEEVTELCRYFKGKGLQVGLDLYAPLMSGFVGQNYKLISEEADFIKPMMYRKTCAPAGIGFEYELLKKSIPGAKGYDEVITGPEFLSEQLKEISGLKCKKYPGIEINYLKGVAETDEAYIKESMDVLKKCCMDGAVLAWDVMNAPSKHIHAAGQ